MHVASGLMGWLLRSSPTPFLSGKQQVCLVHVAFRLSSEFPNTDFGGASQDYLVTEYQRKFILLLVRTEKL